MKIIHSNGFWILALSFFAMLSVSAVVSFDPVLFLAFAEESELDTDLLQNPDFHIGEIKWLEKRYPAKGTGTVQIIDYDMNLNSKTVDFFNIHIWSASDAVGIDIAVVETESDNGLFEGTIFFSTVDESSGHRLKISDGDTVTAKYFDSTLPDEYIDTDVLGMTSSVFVSNAPYDPCSDHANYLVRGCGIGNLMVVDAFGNSLDSVGIDQLVQIRTHLGNVQHKEQSFVYFVQVENFDDFVVSLSWVAGTLSPGQSFSPSISWIPTQAGTYTATAFVWESSKGGIVLGTPISTTFDVGN